MRSLGGHFVSPEERGYVTGPSGVVQPEVGSWVYASRRGGRGVVARQFPLLFRSYGKLAGVLLVGSVTSEDVSVECSAPTV